MTCIVAVEHNGKVCIGGDSAANSGWNTGKIEFKKVFRNGDFLIGYTDSFRMGQLLEYELTVPRQENESDMCFMVTKFVPAVRDLLKNFGYSKVESNQETGGVFLVGYKGKAYQIHNDFQVMRYSRNIYAIGCGEQYALGSLASSNLASAEDRIMEALRVAGIFSNGVCEPYYVESL